MRRLLTGVLIAAAAAGLGGVKAATNDDPYLWLEEVSSPMALDWVEAHNAKSTAILEADQRYKRFYAEALEIAQAKDRIPVGSFIGGEIYNFWQDVDHVRGVWRRASRQSYASGNPEWETVLDLDALAASEKANWV
ncbi:MAG TPA: S9 family peptidase, partial [Sphingomicrobium sp.]|nr:S9 family peptidase [Sphingomicrobium sp.]